MDTDIRRIGIGNDNYPNVSENDNIVPEVVWTFDSVKITFDSVIRTFDEDIV